MGSASVLSAPVRSSRPSMSTRHAGCATVRDSELRAPPLTSASARARAASAGYASPTLPAAGDTDTAS